MLRRAFTLVELLVVIAILAILVALVGGAISQSLVKGPNGQTYYETQGSGIYKCVKTYSKVTQQGKNRTNTEFVVNLRGEKNSVTHIMYCQDDSTANVYNSEELFAQFEAGSWYHVNYVGFHNPQWDMHPIVTSVSEVSDPTPNPFRTEVKPSDFNDTN